MNQRLLPELNRFKNDVRHGIGASAQSLLASTVLIRLPSKSNQERQETFNSHLRNHHEDLALLRWLAQNFAETGQMTKTDSAFLIHILDLYQPGRVSFEQFLELDEVKFYELFETLTSLINPDLEKVPVDVYRIR